MSLRAYSVDRIQAGGASVVADPQGDVQLNPKSGRGVYVGSTQVFDDAGNLQAGSLPSHTHSASEVTSGTFTNARIAQSNVTQHQAALSIGAGQVTPGTFGSGAFTFPGTLDVTGAVTFNSGVTIGSQTSAQFTLGGASSAKLVAFYNLSANQWRWEAFNEAGTSQGFPFIIGGDTGRFIANNDAQFNGTLDSTGAATLDTGANGSSFGGTLDLGSHLAIAQQAGDPTTASNTGHVYTKDVSGTAEVFVQDEAGNATQISPHGPDGYWHLYHYSAKRGQTQVIHVERLLRRLAHRVGLNPDAFIYEFEGTMAEVGDPPAFDDSIPDTKVKRAFRRLNPLAA